MFDQINLDKLGEQATTVAKDAVYLGVGIVVVTVQKSQEQLEEMRKWFEAQLTTGREQWTTLSERVAPQCKAMDEQYAKFEEQYAKFEDRIGELVDEYGTKLPEPFAKAVDATFESAKKSRAQMRELVFGDQAKKATAKAA